MYTQEERQVAQAIIGNKHMCELIAKVFLETEDKFDYDLAKNKSNEELGELLKANLLAELKVKSRFNQLKLLGQESAGKPKPAAKK